MINKKHITIIIAGILTIVASVIYSTTAMTLDAEKMQFLTASLASCSCGDSTNCTSCEKSGSTYSVCSLPGGHYKCTPEGATSYNKCGCSEYLTDCGYWEECHNDPDCWECDDPEPGCWGCSELATGTYWCGT
jgi:hypothetical protein